MRSMYGPDTLLLASKKPRIQELVQKVANLTFDEIKSLDEKPDIIKGLLLIKEFGDAGPKLTVPEKIANRMLQKNTNSVGPLILEGKIYQLAVTSAWIPVNSTQLEICKDWYWIWLETKQILIANNYIQAQAPLVDKLISMSKFIKNGTTSDYKELEDIRRNALV